MRELEKKKTNISCCTKIHLSTKHLYSMNTARRMRVWIVSEIKKKKEEGRSVTLRRKGYFFRVGRAVAIGSTTTGLGVSWSSISPSTPSTPSPRTSAAVVEGLYMLTSFNTS